MSKFQAFFDKIALKLLMFGTGVAFFSKGWLPTTPDPLRVLRHLVARIFIFKVSFEFDKTNPSIKSDFIEPLYMLLLNRNFFYI